MKYLIHIIAIAALAFGWMKYFDARKAVPDSKAIIAKLETLDNLDGDVIKKFADEASGGEKKLLNALGAEIKKKDLDSEGILTSLEGLAKKTEDDASFTGILLTFLTAGYVGIVFVMQILPNLAQRATSAVFESNEKVEEDKMRSARALVAQGDYAGAVVAFRECAVADPSDRMPWLEIVKIQREKMDVPAAAVQTLREALESHPWPENDTAFMMFRLAELYDQDMNDKDSAVAIMQQVMTQFPETRHSANARHKLHEWGVA